MRCMKKSLILLICIIFVFSLVSCKRTDPETDDQQIAALDQPIVNGVDEVLSETIEKKEEAKLKTETVETETDPKELFEITEPQEKAKLFISNTRIPYTEEEMIRRSDLIVKGIVLQNHGYVMTNPDNTRRNAAGEYSTNGQVTEYTVQVEQVYKGEYNQNTIRVKTMNGKSLSPDLILYGEDENTILAEPLERIDLIVGDEYILLIKNITTAVFDEENGFFPTASAGYLYYHNGNFKNDSLSSPVSISAANAAEEIAAALNTVTE